MLCDDFITTTLHSRGTVHFINVKLEQQTCNTCGLNTARALVYYNQKQQSVSDTHTDIYTQTYIYTHTPLTAPLHFSLERTQTQV